MVRYYGHYSHVARGKRKKQSNRPALYPALRPCGLQYAIMQPRVADTTSSSMIMFDTQAKISDTLIHYKQVLIQDWETTTARPKEAKLMALGM